MSWTPLLNETQMISRRPSRLTCTITLITSFIFYPRHLFYSTTHWCELRYSATPFHSFHSKTAEFSIQVRFGEVRHVIKNYETEKYWNISSKEGNVGGLHVRSFYGSTNQFTREKYNKVKWFTSPDNHFFNSLRITHHSGTSLRLQVT